MISYKSNFLEGFNFLGIKIWDFGLKSLSRKYSWFFLFKILFRYPIKSFRGFWDYRQFSKTIDQISAHNIYKNINPGELVSEVLDSPATLLVAMGYCQRPLKTDDQPLTCPSERFSHDCYFVENYHQTTRFPLACSICDIKPIAESTIRAGASFHIMTSAMDIARDIFIPALETQRFRYAIMFICPYSILPITLPLFICGIKFMIIPYTTGDCQNYGEFVRADVGIKPKRTFPLGQNYELILDLLKRMVQNKIQNGNDN